MVNFFKIIHTRLMQRLLVDQRGVIALSFIVVMAAMLGCAFLAIDFARYAVAKNKVTMALDTAVMSSGLRLAELENADQETIDQIRTEAENYFKANVTNQYMGSQLGNGGVPVITAIGDEKLAMQIDGEMKLFGVFDLDSGALPLFAFNQAERQAGQDNGGGSENFGDRIKNNNCDSYISASGWSCGPYKSNADDFNILLDAFYEGEKNFTNNTKYLDVFLSAYTIWRDMLETQGVSGVSSYDERGYPRVVGDELGVLGWNEGINTLNAINMLNYYTRGEKLIISFTNDDETAFIGVPSVSLRVIDKSSNGKIRAAVFCNGDLIDPQRPQVILDSNNRFNLKDSDLANCNNITRVVMGVDKDDPATYAIGTDIIIGEGDPIEEDLKLTK